MTLPNISGAFRCVKDPVLRFSNGGMPIASFTAVADKKRKDEASGEWVDDKVIFVRITCFKQLAEHVADSVTKGTNVVVSGQVSASEWETDNGEKRTTIEVVANEIGVGLFWNTVTVHEGERKGGQQSGRAQQQADPWGGSTSDDPPFLVMPDEHWMRRLRGNVF